MSTIAKQLDEPLLPSNAKKWFVYFVACRSMMAEPLETGEQKDIDKKRAARIRTGVVWTLS